MFRKILLSVLTVVVVQQLARTIWMFGGHRPPVYNHAPGPCRAMTEIDGGSEDIEILPDGTAFITSGWNPVKSAKGRMFIYNVSEADSKARQLQFSEDYDATDFWPHGLALWTDPDSGEVSLYVINHNPGGERVERFRYQRHPEMLVHVETITDPSMRFMNDLTMIDSERFYFTNMLHYKSEALKWLEGLLMLRWGSIVYYDGSRGHVIEHNFIPNGIVLSPDKKYLYVALYHEGIKSYQRSTDGEEKHLQALENIPMYYGVDNVHVDMDTGDVWTAVQNSAIEFFKHEEDRSSLCGSRVMHLKAAEGHLSDVREVYADDGQETSCAASGTYHRGHLLIGTVYDSPTHCLVKEF